MNARITSLKRALQCAVFVAILAGIFFGLTWVMRAPVEESMEDMVGYRNQRDVDVLLYGASSLLRFYQPLEAWESEGFTAYNYVTSAAMADMYKYFIEASRETNEAALYVCDLRTMAMLDDEIMDMAIRNWADAQPVFSPTRIAAITSFLFNRDWADADVASYYIDLLKYHSNYETLLDPEHWKYLTPGRIRNIDKGFTPAIAHVPFEQPEHSDARGELTPLQEKTLTELLDYCDAEELPMLFILGPYIITESDWAVFNTCGDIIASRGYEFVNFNDRCDEIGLDFETDFSDINHVNYLGAQKYTAYLTNYLAEHYDLPDHRGDAAYASWDADRADYAEMQAEWKVDILSLVSGHLVAKQLGETLRGTDDFAEWAQLAQNENYTVLIEEARIVGDPALAEILTQWEIDPAQAQHIGVWIGGNRVYSANGEAQYSCEIGEDGGRGQVPCEIEAGANIRIGDANYPNVPGSLHIVVFDNNYQTVVDEINVRTEANGIVLVHGDISR